jgi:ubiquinone/menaquinone biosynthesis C-methylase UbiE
MATAEKAPEIRSRFNFDQIAEGYDSWYTTAVGKMVDRLEKQAVDEFLPHVRGRETLLEVGCGTGHWSYYFARKGYRVIGVDIAEKMVRLAKRKNIPGAVFVKADADRLPFADGSFQVAVAITVLEFVRDPGLALTEMARCTARGGQVMVGALNRYSFMAFQRKWRSDPVFSRAELLTFWQLRALLARLGKPRMAGSTFCLPYAPILPLARIMEPIGKTLFPFLGNFLVGSVHKCKQA